MTTTARKLMTAEDLDAYNAGPSDAEERAELIHGEIRHKVMSDTPHSMATLGLGSWARRRFHGSSGNRWPGGWWILSEIHVRYTTTNVFDHDLAGWRRQRVPELPTKMTIAPDWACEIMSPGHHKRDLVEKLGVLQTAKVPHYWVIDYKEKLLHIYTLGADGYLVRSVAAGEVVRVAPFEDVELRVDVLFGADDEE